MRKAILGTLAAVLAVSACALVPPRPDRVDLTRDMLRVRMTDGSTCFGPAPRVGAIMGWSGRLQGCPAAYGYTVRIEAQRNPLRLLLEEALRVAGGADLLTPVATVRITDPSGRLYRFATPEPVAAAD